MDNKTIAKEGQILKCMVGSTVHGLNVAGQDDRDYLGICIEPPEYVIGLYNFEQYVFRTKPQGVRSEAGDIDLTIYSLRKFAKLALHGNPSILLLLFAPAEYMEQSALELRNNAQWFASRQAGMRFLGYLTQQKQRLLGERGQKNVKRPELEELYGYDTKYAMHILRLGYQGKEYLETGKLSLPMEEDIRSHIMDVRLGKVDLNDMLTEAGELELELKMLIDHTSPLPEKPDYNSVNTFLKDTYQEFWKYAGY